MQVKYLFGYSQYVIPATASAKAKTVTYPRHDPIHEQLGDLFGQEWTPYFHWREFVMGGAFLVILLSMKEIGKRYPRQERHTQFTDCLPNYTQIGVES